jgi:NADH:ubiquinone oxidoreductase subunit 5 (subunit L)/multisubunit Na+/H+ antiporter MnhA subunit
MNDTNWLFVFPVVVLIVFALVLVFLIAYRVFSSYCECFGKDKKETARITWNEFVLVVCAVLIAIIGTIGMLFLIGTAKIDKYWSKIFKKHLITEGTTIPD